jgi:hypothetical protein
MALGDYQRKIIPGLKALRGPCMGIPLMLTVSLLPLSPLPFFIIAAMARAFMGNR